MSTFPLPAIRREHGVGVALVLAVAAWLGACGASAPSATPPPAAASAKLRAPVQLPQLVIAVVIDQLGSDALRKLEPLLQGGAVAHARAHGRVLEHVVYAYAGTLTAPGHAAIYTGVPPAQNGVTTNAVIDRATGLRRAVVDDGQHAILGVPPPAFASPSVLRAPTVADALKQATGGRAKVVSLSIKDRSAILPAGQHPDVVLWYDARAGFTTSSYYASELPSWLTAFTRAYPVLPASVSWEVQDGARLGLLLGPDDATGEGDYKGLGKTFPHRLRDNANAGDLWAHTPDSTEYLLELAHESAEELALGSDDIPDLLLISISGTDYSGHVFGPDSWEYADHLRRADRALLRLFERLGERSRIAVLITSDHGVAPLPERLGAAASGKRIDSVALEHTVESALDAAFGAGEWLGGYLEPYLFLTPAARAHPAHAAIRAAALQALRAQTGVAAAYDCEQLDALRAATGALEQAVLRSIDPNASGDFFVVVGENVVPDIGLVAGAGTTHGSPWAYDTHVPVLIWGDAVIPGKDSEPLEQARVAATLAALLGIPAPGSAPRTALPGVTTASAP
ncbi:MAG TPA: alkaline phosphatase family protein [Polyangiales bacterium]|nr:alkaline phosphatase family protein [Polyangiales bacterium]